MGRVSAASKNLEAVSNSSGTAVSSSGGDSEQQLNGCGNSGQKEEDLEDAPYEVR
jgi:hypothetical protein